MFILLQKCILKSGFLKMECLFFYLVGNDLTRVAFNAECYMYTAWRKKLNFIKYK